MYQDDVSHRQHLYNQTRGSYKTKAFNPLSLRKVVARIADYLVANPAIVAVAARGQSGIIVYSAVSYATGVPIICVRKDGEESHDGSSVLGYCGEGQYVIIDDLIGSGHTINRIVKDIEARQYPGLTPHSVLLYESAYTDGTRDENGQLRNGPITLLSGEKLPTVFVGYAI